MNTEPIKVLLVDDTPENLVALEALLRRPDLVLLKATSGNDALELLLAHDVSLALLDVQMPEMDGFELAELMRGADKTKHVPIIFVTAGARDPQRVFKGYETGAVDFLFKPIDAHVLRSKVDVFVELAKQRRALEDALRLNEIFVAILGHDLRNPLGAMLTGAELLEQQLADERRLATIRRMLSSGRRMRVMIDQLLDLSRARLAGGIGFRHAREIVDLRELVQRVGDELRIAHPKRPLVIDASGDTSLIGDPGRLMQLFSNLLANALTHGTPETPVTVTLAGRSADVRVSIHNHGAISEDILPALFEPFRRAREARTAEGLGLGLYIAQQIAEAHAGELSVESTPTAGTTFVVRISR
jgi:signal transduction histidine kinase